MSANYIESTAYLRDAFWVIPATSDARAEEEILQFFAPRDLSASACLRDTVVKMGEKPDSFAS